MSGYRPSFFGIKELVPSELFKTMPPQTLWMMLDDRLLIAADTLRHRYGKMVCNTWAWGGTNEYRGLRPPDCKIGATFSMHKLGRALDLIPVQCTAEEIREDLRHFKKGDRVYDGRNYISRVEDKVGWLHIDTANAYPGDTIYFFNP